MRFDRTPPERSLCPMLPLLLLMAATAPAALAQENITVGVGISVNPAAVAGDNSSHFQTPGMADYYVTAQIGDILRTDVQFGILIRSSDQTYGDSLGEFNGHTSGVVMRFGFGAFYTWRPDSSFTVYAGPRTGVMASSSYVTYSRPTGGYPDQKTIWGAFFISGCLGAEYALTHHLSIGGEFQFTSTGFGVPNMTPPATGYPRDFKESVLSTDALVFIRFFF